MCFDLEIGKNKSLFTLIAVIIFGIFLILIYWLFQDELVNVLASGMDKTSETKSIKLDNAGLYTTSDKYFLITVDVVITDYTGDSL